MGPRQGRSASTQAKPEVGTSVLNGCFARISAHSFPRRMPTCPDVCDWKGSGREKGHGHAHVLPPLETLAIAADAARLCGLVAGDPPLFVLLELAAVFDLQAIHADTARGTLGLSRPSSRRCWSCCSSTPATMAFPVPAGLRWSDGKRPLFLFGVGTNGSTVPASGISATAFMGALAGLRTDVLPYCLTAGHISPGPEELEGSNGVLPIFRTSWKGSCQDHQAVHP